MCPVAVGAKAYKSGRFVYAAAEQKCTFDFSKTVAPRAARLGEAIAVTLTIKNTSTTNAVTLTGAAASDALGDQPVTFTEKGSDPACKRGNMGTVTCTFGQVTIQPGKSVSLQFVVTVLDLEKVPPKGRKVTNSATLTCGECGTKGITSEARYTVLPQVAVSIDKTAVKANVPIGDPVTYEITVTNAKDSVSEAEPDTIDITDTLPDPPPDYTFTVRAQAGWSCRPGGGSAAGKVKPKVIKCSYKKALGKGDKSSKVFVELKPNAGAANKVGDTYKNKAEIVSTGEAKNVGNPTSAEATATIVKK